LNNNILKIEIMASSKDWVKTNHGDFNKQVTGVITYLLENKDRLNFGDKMLAGIWLVTQFLPTLEEYRQIFKEWQDEAQRTPAIQFALEQAEAKLKPLFRQLYTGFLKNTPFVTNDDLRNMGLPTRHIGGGKPAHIATVFPGCRVLTPIPGRLEWHYYDIEGDRHRARPEGQHGVEIAWSLADSAVPPITDASSLRHSDFDTHSPFVLTFEGHDRGKIIFYSLRWENTRGEKGPWSPVDHIFIP
jgi:hypothetical protein